MFLLRPSSLRAVFALTAAILTFELCARVEDTVRYGAPLWGTYDSDSLYYFDATGKHAKPNAAYLKWKLNEAGYRGPALRSAAYRIVCMGSSETFGLYESEGMEWPRQLESQLNGLRIGSDFEVVNAAYPGMTIAAYLRDLDQMMATLHPRMVIIYPSYIAYIDPPGQQDRESAGQPQKSFQPPDVPFTPRMKSRIETLLKKTLPDELQNWIRGRQVEMATRSMRTMSRLPESAVQRFEDDLTVLVTRIQKHGAQVVLVTHATRFGTRLDESERPMLVAWRKFYPVLEEDGLLDMERRMSAALMRTGERARVPVIDAATQLKPGSENFVEFVHFTDTGAHALASLVSTQITPYLSRR